jgi:hypothetical protein
MVDHLVSTQSVPIQIRLAVINTQRVSNLIGRIFSCQENECRIEADLTRVCEI